MGTVVAETVPETFYVTFGQQYARKPHPRFRGAHPDGYLVVEAVDLADARMFAVSLLGTYWSDCYGQETAETWKAELFPAGVLARFVTPAAAGAAAAPADEFSGGPGLRVIEALKRMSADRLREKLGRHDRALRAYRGETLYHLEVDFTCRLLDVVDEVTDEVTAALITDVIYERLTGDGVSAAAQRIRDTQAELARLMRELPRPLYADPQLPPRRWPRQPGY